MRGAGGLEEACTHVERSTPLWRTELVTDQREQVHAQVVHLNGDLPGQRREERGGGKRRVN
jgi:hypothetical protein